MNRSLTSLFAAFEALLVVAIGIGISLAPLTVLWGFQYGFAPDWWSFWRASVDIWLIGHGVDVTVTLNHATAVASGLAGASVPFTITLAALGFSLLTVLLGVRAGRRIAETDHRLVGEFVAVAVFAGLSFGVTLSARFPSAEPSLLQGTLLPALVFALGILVGTLKARSIFTDVADRLIRARVSRWRATTQAAVAAALRGGASAAAAIVAAGAAIVGVLIFASYAQIITLYEGLHGGAIGGLALTLGQIAVMPNLVLWGVSWLVGPGFAIGTGSTVSPLVTALGPIPAIPVLGALPTADSAFAFVGLLVPILAGFLAGALLAPRIAEPGLAPRSLTRIIATGLGMGVVGGIVLGFLAWVSSGSAGPGRLATVGPNPWMVALFAALEIGIAAALGLYAASHAPRGPSAVRETSRQASSR